MEIRKVLARHEGNCNECHSKDNEIVYLISIRSTSLRLCHRCLCALADELERIATGLKHD